MQLSKKHHPDAPGGNKDRFLEINDAYHTLGDDARRYVHVLITAWSITEG